MIIKLIKEILFPVFCAECGAEGEWWCKKCFEKHKIRPVLRCPGCGKINNGELCLGCRGFHYLDGAVALMEYSQPEPASRLIRDFKYKFARDIRPVWEMIAEKCLPDIMAPNESVIIPVPLYARRERERGFNQAKILAEIFIEKIKKYFPNGKYSMNDSILWRVRGTAQQAKLSKEEREKNVCGAFAVKNAPAPASIILVDDIFTTGTTLNECAKVLKNDGAKTVWALTLARTI